MLMQNIGSYKNFEQFVADVEWMVHNCIILYTSKYKYGRHNRKKNLLRWNLIRSLLFIKNCIWKRERHEFYWIISSKKLTLQKCVPIAIEMGIHMNWAGLLVFVKNRIWLFGPNDVTIIIGQPKCCQPMVKKWWFNSLAITQKQMYQQPHHVFSIPTEIHSIKILHRICTNRHWK